MKSSTRMITVLSTVTLALSCSLFAQPAERPEANIDDIVVHLGLSDSQITCLESNRQSLHDAVAPIGEQIRPLQRALRQAARGGADTSAIQAEIDALRATAEGVKASHVASAGSCIDASQAPALAELIAAETLQREVRQGVGLLLVEPSEERTGQITDAAPRGKRRGPQRGERPGPRSN